MLELGEELVRDLTEIDHHGHEAMIALEEETGDGIGIARYVLAANQEMMDVLRNLGPVRVLDRELGDGQ